MPESPVKTKFGLYPATHNFNVELGEYGEWKGGQWCRLGNIFTDFGHIYFNKSTKKCDRTEEYNQGVSISGGAGVSLEAQAGKAELSLKFKSIGAIYYKAHVTKESRFMSVKNEVYSFLQNFIADGRWNEKYWLAVEVWYADHLLSLQSNSSGGEAIILGQVGNTIQLPNAKMDLSVQCKNAEISLLQFNDKEQFAGAKFVGFNKEGVFRKKLVPEYKGESFDYEVASEQVVYS